MNRSCQIGFLIILSWLIMHGGSLFSQQTMPVGIDSVVITFSQPPTQIEVEKAPLKYNKDFALSFQMDDALSDIYDIVYPLFEGVNGSGGLYYSNGCGQNISFKMTSGIYIFTTYNGSDLLDPDDPWHNPDMLTWNSLNTLYQSGWGIVNHGVFSEPQAGSVYERNYEIRRTQSYARRKIDESFLIKTFIIPNGNLSYVDQIFENNYHLVLDEESSTGWLNKNNDGVEVEHDTINWLHPKKVSRYFGTYYGLKATADRLSQASQQGVHKWIPWGMHDYPGSFTADFQYIYNTYGSPGLDNVLITTEDEILDYLAVKQETELVSTIHNQRLTLTFGGEIPADRLHYDLSMNVFSDQNITDIQVYGGESNSYSGINNDTALINLSWDGRYYYPVEYLADSFTTVASSSQAMYDCLVAMDYVLLSEAGPHKDSLRHILCDINQTGWKYNYDVGFCNFLTVDLGNDTSVCSGNCVPLVGPSGMASYQWLVADTLFATSSSIEACPSYSTQFTLNVIDVDGTQASDSILISTLPLPVVFIGNDTTLCWGDSLKLVGPQPAEGDYFEYLWSTGSTLDSIVVQPIETAYVSLSVTNASGCTSSDTIEIQVASLPVIDTVLGDTISCLGDTVVFEVVGTGFNSYLWSTGDTTRSISVSPQVADSVYVYVVQVFSYNQCMTADTVRLFVSGFPVIDAIVGDTIACLHDTIQYQVLGTDMSSFFWSTGDTNQQMKVSPTVGDRSYTYKVYVRNLYQCMSVDSVSLFVSNPPVIDSIAGDTLCLPGDSVLLEVRGQSMHSFLWNTGDTTQNIQVSPLGSDTNYLYSVEVYNQFGCISYDSLEVYVSPEIVIDLGADTAFCKGGCIPLSGPDSMALYAWTVADTLFANTQDIVACPEITSQFSLYVENVYGDTDSDSILLIVMPSPEFSLRNDTLLCQGDSLVLSGPTAPSGDVYQYLWSTGAASQSIVVHPEMSTTYTLLVTNIFNCSNSDDVSIVVIENPVIDTIDGDSLGCLGDTIQLTVQGIGIDSYLWSTGATTQSILISPVVGDSSYLYKSTVFNSQGCFATDSTEVFFAANPIIDTITGGGSYCWGDSVWIEVVGTGSASVWWNTGDTSQIISLVPEVGTHTYVVTLSNSFGCQVTDSLTLQVNSLPIVDSIVGDTSLCAGDSTLLEVWGSDIESYLWNTGDTTQVINYLPQVYDTTYVLSVLVTNGSGCQKTDSALVVVNKEVWVDFESDTLAICQGEDAYITVGSSSNISNFHWVYGSLDSTTLFGNFLFQSPEISSYVYVRGDSYAGCYAYDSLYLSIQSYPEIVISNDTSICSGQLVMLSIEGGSLFYWAVDGDTLSYDSTLEVTPMDTIVYTVGTAFAHSLCFRDTAITVNVMAMPTTTILYDTNLVCEHSTVTLLAEGADSYEWRPSGQTGENYHFIIQDTTKIWLTGVALGGCVATDSLTINTLVSPVVGLSGIYPAYCLSDPPTQMIGQPVGGMFSGAGVVDSIFDPLVAGEGDHLLVYTFENELNCVGYDTILTHVYGGGLPIDLGADAMLMPTDELVLNAGIGFDSYFWSTGSVDQSITVYGGDNPSGTYEYKVIGLISGCTSTGSINITFYNTDFIDATKAGVIHLYPNPNKGIFSIVIPYSKEPQTVRLFSLQGDLVFESADHRCAEEACVLEVELPNLNDGLYTLQLISGELVYINKMMIRK